MEIFDNKKKFINGPVNVVRLQGNIQGINKVIYLFMDQHYPLGQQTQCENLYADSIQKYFADNFKKLNSSSKTYDFFMEIRPTELEYNKNNKISTTRIYIVEMWKLFSKIFQYNDKENRVYTSESFKNVRLHYMDIRDYLKYSQKGYLVDIFNEMLGLVISMWNYSSIMNYNIKKIVSNLTIFKNFCIFLQENIVKILSDQKTSLETRKIVKNYGDFIKRSTKDNSWNLDIIYLLNKMSFSYKHDHVKNKLRKQLIILKDSLVQLINEADKIINIFKKISNFYDKNNNILRKQDYGYGYGISQTETNEMVLDMTNSILKLNSLYIHHFSRFMDLFFLRRFLDKDYITNAIAYTGSAHSCTYIEILTQDFGFEITHVSYSKIKNLSKLNIYVKTKISDEIEEIFYPQVLSQCSDLSDFPDGFE
ncbi:hypothetical protein QJ854_gp771 [Moumouvirus goulette]|uniref:Uncharacterized protein n=1 Tax=Moumouvirus goulette TaxID=1247379 RepID=M1PM59_9VIRU|nr:hypothetical protein QJ854_gp771 [Moumouvirus goulette]AGF85011.1 hypothetical protein glt_00202 [Moumouvirus goulette]